ncbi:MAG TPA: sigma-70 family RNA polymerase sigma factor [Actinomycetota bacterium]|nr:sigma-70 family RNA polymerase sigma factor [Actinomycetota bacterium]
MREASDRSDDLLLDDFLTGEQEAFDELMRRHEARIFALAFRMTGSRADALDATQDTFVAAFRQAHKFRKDAAFGTWLFRIGINACKDFLRKRNRHPWEGDEQLEHTAAPGDVERTASLRVDIVRALEALPEEYREAVCMHDLGGIPYEEIARLSGAPVGTIKSRISRGRRRLAELLELPAATTTSKDET